MAQPQSVSELPMKEPGSPYQYEAIAHLDPLQKEGRGVDISTAGEKFGFSSEQICNLSHDQQLALRFLEDQTELAADEFSGGKPTDARDFEKSFNDAQAAAELVANGNDLLTETFKQAYADTVRSDIASVYATEEHKLAEQRRKNDLSQASYDTRFFP